jgi:hypothetical protein
MLLCLFLALATIKKGKQSNPPKLTTDPTQSHPSTQREKQGKKPTGQERKHLFACVCGHAGHLDEFCFQRKKIERRRVEYSRNSYHDEFIDFPPHSYSHVPPCFYSCVLPRTSSHAFTQFSYGPNHHSYGFGSRENRLEPRRFGYGLHPRYGDCFPRRSGFPAGGSYTHFELRHMDGPCFAHCGSHPTQPSGEVQRTMKTPSGCMVKCWIPKIYLTNPSTEPSTFSRPM